MNDKFFYEVVSNISIESKKRFLVELMIFSFEGFVKFYKEFRGKSSEHTIHHPIIL